MEGSFNSFGIKLASVETSDLLELQKSLFIRFLSFAVIIITLVRAKRSAVKEKRRVREKEGENRNIMIRGKKKEARKEYKRYREELDGTREIT